MTDYTGTALVASFINAGGTLTLNTDYRSVTVTPSIGMLKASAGSDTSEHYITTLKDNKYSVKMLAQAGGTVLESQLVPGTAGTLIIGREGTVAGKPKETCPVKSLGGVFNIPYAGLVEVSCDFQGDGDRTLGVYP